MQAFNFNPEQGFLDTGVYTDPTSETEARTQLFSLHDQTRTFINSMVNSINSMEDEIETIAAATGIDPTALAQILAALQDATIYYFTDTVNSPTADTSIYAAGYKKTYNSSLIDDATEIVLNFPNHDYNGEVCWETKASGDVDLIFSKDPTGLAIRVTIIATQATVL